MLRVIGRPTDIISVCEEREHGTWPLPLSPYLNSSLGALVVLYPIMVSVPIMVA